MPCCGLSEFRHHVPLKYTFTGTTLFWGIFALSFFIGVLLSWNRIGRGILAAEFEFVKALWRETMRQPDSIPAKWSCRLSGYLLPLSPGLAATVFRHPELPIIIIMILGGLLIVGVTTLRLGMV